jgi:hypothetical protein
VYARLLTGSQYSNTVLDLFGVEGDPGKDLGDRAFDTLDDVRVEQRADVAAKVARDAVLNFDVWAPCSADSADVSACADQLIAELGPRIYRRPLTAEDTAQMRALFDAGLAEQDFMTGVEWWLTGALQSPDFLYEIVLPAPGEVVGEVRELDAHAYASRLAYFLWDSPPDAELIAAANENALSDAAVRQAQIERMLAHERFLRSTGSFYHRWLNLGAFDEIARDAEGFNGEVAQSLLTSLELSVRDLYSSESPNLSDLFTGDTYYMNGTLKEFYGLEQGGEQFEPVTMSGEGRQGILTHPALMALMARPQESFPIGRGLFVTHALLCVEVPLPNGLVIPELPPIQEGLSTRERLEAHTADPTCAGCHSLFDPPGYALESFDEVGRYRTIDHGKPVVTSGTMALSSDVDGAFETGGELLSRLPSSQDIRGCFARQYMQFALSRQKLLEADECSYERIEAPFRSSGDLKDLVAAIAASDAIRLRKAEGVQ